MAPLAVLCFPCQPWEDGASLFGAVQLQAEPFCSWEWGFYGVNCLWRWGWFYPLLSICLPCWAKSSGSQSALSAQPQPAGSVTLPAALTSLTPLLKDLMNSDCLHVLQSVCHVFAALPCDRSGWSPAHLVPGLQPSTVSSLLPHKWTCRTCGLLWCSICSPSSSTASLPKSQKSPVPFPQRTPGTQPSVLTHTHTAAPEYSLLNLICLQSQIFHDRTLKTKLEDQYPKKKKIMSFFLISFANM